MADNWTTIESDPGVFTELIETFGVKGVQVEELWEPSAEALEAHAPVYGVIFLFKWGGESQQGAVGGSAKPKAADDCPGLYFANQIVNNACATQAILGILLNNSDKIELGENLTKFKMDTMESSPKARGIAIGNNEVLRQAHNSFRVPEVIEVTDKKAVATEDPYHFVCYVQCQGRLYEIDGLQSGPIDHGDASPDDWLQKVAPVIQERMIRYAESETGFSMLALVGNKKQIFQSRLEQQEIFKTALEAKISGSTDAMDMDSFQVEGLDLSGSPEELQAKLDTTNTLIEELQLNIAEEDAKFAAWTEENIRRRHNYVPFLFNLLQVLANKGHLPSLIDKAKTKAEARHAKKLADAGK
jgi:ubiquitin carboxyl-terminal hydrolase L5